jgi:hypothetical protein
MPGRRGKAVVAPENINRWQAAIEVALATARRHLRRQRALRGLAFSFSLPIFGFAAWVAATRFTLLDLPEWPAAVFPIFWFLAFAVWLLRGNITRAQCGRYLDARLGLDERVSTCLELDGRARLGHSNLQEHTLTNELVADTATVLNERIHLLPNPWGYRLKLWHSAAGSAALLALVAALILPTSFDLVRTEQDIVRDAMATQARQLASLRAELVARPELSDAIKEDLAAELEALEARLLEHKSDRAEALAALAAAEEKVRSLMPGAASTDFDSLVRAAQLVQAGASLSTDWDPSLSVETNDLGRAAEASSELKSYINQFTTVQARAAASSLERASAVASAKDAGLAQSLVDSGASLRRNDQDKAAEALQEVSTRFREIERQQQSVLAVERTLAEIEDGRETIAKAGTTATKRGQVGFRRTEAQAGTGGVEAQQAEGAGADGQATDAANNNPSGLNVGQNQPAFGPVPGTGASNGQQGANQGGGTNGSAQGQPQAGGNPGGGAQPGGSGGGQGTGAQGPVQGPISGPIRGPGGSNNPGGGAEGYGTGAASPQPGSPASQAERVYVPGRDTTVAAGGAGQAAPERQDPNAIGGRVGEGATEDELPGGPGPGSIAEIRTPYTEVLGEYSKEALSSLERSYVPPDAKEYVRNYFTALGK